LQSYSLPNLLTPLCVAFLLPHVRPRKFDLPHGLVIKVEEFNALGLPNAAKLYAVSELHFLTPLVRLLSLRVFRAALAACLGFNLLLPRHEESFDRVSERRLFLVDWFANFHAQAHCFEVSRQHLSHLLLRFVAQVGGTEHADRGLFWLV